ncbi:hypothetical protein OP10G_1590 [Fimbriimonas ginsengisoli Gsoil 348]|uniref:Glyoxalase-like domain-containing protein n=1 Tax=Fimbriimonas ginsengisoli Gsoil 348 TaxID=661478 RepID=A0A068NN22_FIMGI|nr:hypothetical protein OP10G_1590 [Fimbriimonas ginsengisoli Gsoil 348]
MALGGFNLEFLQLDEGAPSAATIRTLVFEPIDLAVATRRYEEMGIPMSLREKWEPDPELLRLRGFDEDEARTPQLICRNLYPSRPAPFDFFLCDYAPKLKERLSPSALPSVPAVTQLVLAVPAPASDGPQIDRLFGTAPNLRPEIVLSEKPGDLAEVIEIRSERGPLDLPGRASRFRFA